MGVFQLAASLVVLTIACDPARACALDAQAKLYDGFDTGEQWLKVKEPAARAYVRGYLNGLFMSAIVGAQESCLDRISICIEGKTDQQLAALLRKYLDDHPAERQLPLTTTTYNALTASCLRG